MSSARSPFRQHIHRVPKCPVLWDITHLILYTAINGKYHIAFHLMRKEEENGTKEETYIMTARMTPSLSFLIDHATLFMMRKEICSCVNTHISFFWEVSCLLPACCLLSLPSLPQHLPQQRVRA